MDYGKLKTYYESIDGVTVPFVYPQYWDKDKEEWVVVDKDNRLPVDARLTGSNVELIAEVNGAFVPAGTKVKVIDKVDTSDFLYIFVQVRPRGLRDYTVSYRPFMGNENVEITEITFLDITEDRSNKVSDNRRPFGLNVSLYVENKTQEDNENFEVYLFGVRR